MDLTTRACGDCGFHALVVLQAMMAKRLVPQKKPKAALKPLLQEDQEMPVLRDLSDSEG